MDSNGLTIRNITERDDGVYTCRAEVHEDGRYDERRIIVAVHSQYIVKNDLSFSRCWCLLKQRHENDFYW